MKKIIITSLFASILLSSCADDVLDREPIDVITEDVVWSDPNLIESNLAQAYAQTTVFVNETWQPEHISTQHFMPFIINGVSDEARNNRNWSGNAAYYKANGINQNGGLLEWYEWPYKIIRNLNMFIEKVPTSALDDEIKEQRIAEAKFLRAFNYFSMVKRYGGVPLVTEVLTPNSPEEKLYPKRNKEQEVYDFIIQEMDEISKTLPESVGANDYGRPSKYAALALKSRAALYAGSIAKYGTVQLNGILGIEKDASYYYQQSLEASNEIINSGAFELYNAYPDDKAKNYRHIFLDERNIETIFSKQHLPTDKSAGGNGFAYDFFQAPVPNAWGGGNQSGPYLEMVESYEYIDGTSGKLDYTQLENQLYTIEELWANKDPRFAGSIYTQETPWQGGELDFHAGIVLPDGTITYDSYQGIPGRGRNKFTGFGVLKYLDEGKNNLTEPYSSQVDWIVFRYAEILLNKAEAAYELGNPAEALIQINKIRERAGIASKVSIDFNDIKHERKIELAFEGHRYWDLRRWRNAEAVLTINRSGLQYIYHYDTGKYKLSIIKNYDGRNNPIFFSHNYYFPITAERIGKNPSLIENPGY